MRDENEKSISNQNMVSEYNKAKPIAKPNMTASSFMKCLDKFLGFDRNHLKKKHDLKLVEIKHRPYNRYSYFNNKKDNDKFNTVTGRGITNDLKINNSMVVADKRQNSFVKGSAVKNERRNSITKKKEVKNTKMKLNFKFRDDLFEDNRSNVKGKGKKDNKSIKDHEIKTTELNEQDNFNLSDSEKYFSANSSHYSQDD